MGKTSKPFRKNQSCLLAAAIGITLAGCSDDATEQLASQNVQQQTPTAILFSNVANTVTRASHTESAALLKNSIVFFGDKTTSAGATNTIFDNYRLQYTAGSAGKTETNVNDWEYVGLTSLKNAVQDVKYWDYTSTNYNFVAAAGLGTKETITDANGMKIHVASPSAMDSIYIADRITVQPTDYNKTVQFQFRRLGARMRIGFYETVPGYAIKNLIFYYVGAPSGNKILGVGGAFPLSGAYNVTYGDDNVATVKFNGGSNVTGWSSQFGELDYTYAESKVSGEDNKYIDEKGKLTASQVKKFLSGTSAQPTYAKGSYTIDGKENTTSDYKPILPNENNTLKMQLRVDYTLVALDGSGDEIKVRDAYVSVPVEYLQWKPNHAYTYIFKISDKSNGYTGKNDDSSINPETGGRDPQPDNGGGDNDPDKESGTDEVIPPYVPDPSYPDPYIPDPDDPEKQIPNPDVPLVPNPEYPTGPEGDQHDPSNPVPTPKDPLNPDQPDPDDPAGLYPITFDAVVVDTEENKHETITSVTTPSITTYSPTSSVTVNGEYKVGENITLSIQDGMTPDQWQYLSVDDEITENKAAQLYGNSTLWTDLGTATKATLTPQTAGYYVVRVKVGNTYGYKVIKVVE